MARFYSDENFPAPVSAALRRLGHDVLTIQEAGGGNQGIEDEAVLEFARSHERILVSINRKHFIQLHTLKPDHCGIIVCTFDPDFIGQAHRIHIAHESTYAPAPASSCPWFVVIQDVAPDPSNLGLFRPG